MSSRDYWNKFQHQFNTKNEFQYHFNTLEVLKSPNSSIPKGEGWIRWLNFFQKQFKLSNKWSNISKDNRWEMQTLFIVVWWKVRLSDYLLKCPRSRLVVSLTIFLASSHEWNYEYENHSFFTAQEPWPSFSWRKTKISREKRLLFLKKKNLYFFFVF